MIVGDQEEDVRVLGRILVRAGRIEVRGTGDPSSVRSICIEFGPDLVLLDLDLPFARSYDLLDELTALLAGTGVPVLAMTADRRLKTRVRALSLGARDLVSKPFYIAELLWRIRHLLDMRSLYLQLQRQRRKLGENHVEHARQLEAIEIDMLERLAISAEHRDDKTGWHIKRVGQTAARLARTLGLPPHDVTLIERAAPLHDIGKIGIPDGILLKPGKLTADEFGVVKNHTVIGAEILSSLAFPLLEVAREIALSHHERWDGEGYPRGLRGQDIPLTGRIVGVADAYDVITHRRPYKEARTEREALDEITREHGRHFDPQLVEAFRETQEA